MFVIFVFQALFSFNHLTINKPPFQISFPGVKMYAFHILLCYIYSDKIPCVEPARCLELLELANRLCMNRLVALVEAKVLDQLQRRDR